MNRPILVLATVGLLDALGIGAVAVGSRPSTTTPTPTPTARAAVEAGARPAVIASALPSPTSDLEEAMAFYEAQTGSAPTPWRRQRPSGRGGAVSGKPRSRPPSGRTRLTP